MKRASIVAGCLIIATSATAFAQQATTGGTPSANSTPMQTEDLGNITPSQNPNMTPISPQTGVRSKVGNGSASTQDSGYTTTTSTYPSPYASTYPSAYPGDSGVGTSRGSASMPDGTPQGATTGMAGSGPGVPANQNGMGTTR